jgi:small subunit ribosomal protein S20
MPVIKSAKKKLRQDKKRQLANKKTKNTYKDLLKQTRENPSDTAMQQAFSSLDKAAKKGIIHPNKAARLKAALSQLPITKKTPSLETKKTTISPKKTPPKK